MVFKITLKNLFLSLSLFFFSALVYAETQSAIEHKNTSNTDIDPVMLLQKSIDRTIYMLSQPELAADKEKLKKAICRQYFLFNTFVSIPVVKKSLCSRNEQLPKEVLGMYNLILSKEIHYYNN